MSQAVSALTEPSSDAVNDEIAKLKSLLLGQAEASRAVVREAESVARQARHSRDNIRAVTPTRGTAAQPAPSDLTARFQALR